MAGMGADQVEAAEDAGDVAVDDCGGGVIGEGSDGAGGVGADSREGLQDGRVARDLAGEIGGDSLGGGVEVESPGVISQTLPEAQNLLLFGCSQGLDGWEAMYKATEIGDCGGDLGLLEHEFTDQNYVWVYGCKGMVAGRAPGEVAAVSGVPTQQGSGEIGPLVDRWMCWRHGDSS